MKIEEIISGIQKKLGVQVDGRAGPETWGAIYACIVKPKIGGIAPAEAVEPVDSRSEKYIATLLPEVRPVARSLVQKAGQSGIRIRIISGLSNLCRAGGAVRSRPDEAGGQSNECAWWVLEPQLRHRL